MGGQQVLGARQLLAESLDGLPEHELPRAACAVVAELGAPVRLRALLRELAAGDGDPEGCARLSYRHVLGFDKLLLIDGGPRHMLRAHLWHPGKRSAAQEDIHNHRSPLASYVVSGHLGMELYEQAGGEGVAAQRYEESLAREGDWLLEPRGPARLRLIQHAEYGPGSSYALHRNVLHRAWCTTEQPTVTLFLETGETRRAHTDVFARSPRHAPTVAKSPLAVGDYLAELAALRDLVDG
ncbi:hypothetical protein ACFQVC_01825 [Streptomyces monticola]|uniref:Cysteine dioxygenase n=1 Tax=Streptomyces monticola TaxID=2666263 RepID=A0ABW2JC36_9ACTN